MLRPPYTTETPILISAKGEAIISLLEVDGDERYADLSVSYLPGRSIPLSPLLEWLASNRPELLLKAQSESERIKEQGAK